ncbi:MAG: gfo/Idh/MocA family oxidoreductase [Verrucomicrobiaceae bacterium]|nr:gfo/Idh/MocA family oxidoreductase [Verrucomicrobiaceae bacterium]
MNFTTRRHFLETAALTSLAGLVAPLGFGQTAQPKLRVGCIGCGGRGTFVANILKDDGGYELAALADYFEDSGDKFGDTFGIAKERRFNGLDGYKKLLADPTIDAVAIHSPPCFHAEQLIAAVEAGKHVLVAKPIAIDVPSCERVREAVKKAAERGIVVYVDVQSRGDALFQEGIKRMHDGAIGDFTYGMCSYEADTIPLKVEAGTPEARLRNWIHYKALGGDIITEQNIHAVDIMSWALGQPVRATGMSGRKAITFAGDTADHYAVNFQFQQGSMNFTSRQYTVGGMQFVCSNKFYGSKGVFMTDFGGRVMIRAGKEGYWPGGITKDLYHQGSVNNARLFHQQATSRKPEGNATVEPAIQTVLLTLLGQMAAEEKRTVTFEELIKAAKVVSPDLSGLKA